ncbi:2-phospho-L-lactate transferase CofD family protein [uncultured Dysosmobacter sp.]|uniref:2-phospho-L-lactate transferase CofD family protein n=1 Tax=uncultured Dysosmobacter sp. TaxID=2591384 RepID=UPI00262E64A9|nr:2-phospho-L-lactate transferase CofD family protein [uncultured Dysosmobacter sp.]
MIKIVLFSGGTGSIAIQKGFAALYGYDNYRMDVVINAYDNGKSTGACRKVFAGKILGPSDLRKNQLTQYELTYQEEIQNKSSYEAKLLDLFKLRFDAQNYADYYRKARTLLEGSDFLYESSKTYFLSLLKFFFQDPENEKYREAVQNVDFHDFSLSNIFYAACAAQNGYSLSEAGKKMSEILRIENRVHLISDINLYLKAETESGKRIGDEGDIVTWKNPKDRIRRVVLENCFGNEFVPTVDERNIDKVSRLICDADLIIFSSGTQWSSLIPTYMHKGFRDLIRDAKAKKYLVMNNVEDYDMTGLSANEVLEIISKYLDLDDVTILLNDNAAESMRHVDVKYRQIHEKLSMPQSREHIPEAIVSAIMRNYFQISGHISRLISDLDGTLWDEYGDSHTKVVGSENLALFRGTVFSGNSYDHVYVVTKEYFTHHDGGKIYCDYGNTFFTLNEDEGDMHTLNDAFALPCDMVAEIEKDADFAGKVINREGSVITVKPLTDREEKLSKIHRILKKYGDDYKANLAGRTSIDIMNRGLDKAASLKFVISLEGWEPDSILYIGNELTKGHEVCILGCGVRTLAVEDVFETNLFLKTWAKWKRET